MEPRLPIVLTPQELIELTGYRSVVDQILWLKENKFIYVLGRGNTPRVDRTHYLIRMGGVAPAPRDPSAEPNWAAMDAIDAAAKAKRKTRDGR